MLVQCQFEANSRIEARATLVAFLMLLVTLLCACAAPAPAAASNGASNGALTEVVTVPVTVTVEVTKETVREVVVPATLAPPAPCAPTRLADANEIVVAVLTPVSSANSLPTALSAQSGLILALDELNKTPATDLPPLRLWWADSANDPDVAALRAEEAITQQCAVAIISASNSDTNAAIDVVAQRWSTPLLVVDGMDDALTAGQSPTLFRLTLNNSMVASAYAGWMNAVGDYNGDGVTQATVIVENNDWAKLQAQLIADAMLAQQIQVEVYPVDLPAADFSSLIARLVVKETLPDAVFVRLGGDSGIQLHRQLLENGVGPTRKSLIVSARSHAEMPAFWSALGAGGAWSVMIRAGAWHGTVNGASQEFVDEYGRLFGRWPEMTAFAAHDALLLVVDAIQRAGTPDGESLISALEESDISLAGGHYRFGADEEAGNASADWMWHQWLGQPILFMQLTAPNQPLDDAVVLWPPQYAGTDAAYIRPSQ